MDKKIVIRIPKPTSNYTGVIRLNRDAEEVIKRLQAKTGLSASGLASQIILQAEDLITVERED